MNEELTGLIINELGKHRDRENIIMAVCEKGGLDWPQAEKLIQQVEEENKRTITRRQSPILIAISVVTVIAGMVLLGYGILFFVGFFQADLLQRAFLLRTGYFKILGMVTGLGMFGGGMYGLYKTFFQLFEA
jgi:uncharacterized membrane protein